jgi:hypothetical protein
MKRENFYRRDPSKALSGMIGLSLEERGVYNTILDLLYSTWRPLEDDRAFIANWCGCAVQKLNPIVRRLVERGRLISFEEGGRTFLSDEAFEAERATVKGATGTRSGRGEVGEKSGEVGEKSAGVEKNPLVLDTDIKENQSLTALDKSREDKSREDGGVVGASAPVLVSVSDWPEGDAQAHARLLVELVGSAVLDPARSMGLVTTAGRIAAWRREGASWVHDVAPVVAALCAKRREPVSSWKFFDAAVARSIADNREALTIPDAATRTRATGPPSWSAQVDAATAEARRRLVGGEA